MKRRAQNRNYYEQHREEIAKKRASRQTNELQMMNGNESQNATNSTGCVRRQPKAFFKAAIQDYSNNFIPQKFSLGDLCKECTYCSGLSYRCESTSNCCHNGKLSHLPVPSTNFPAELKYLFTGSEQKCKNFREFIRQYNNANAFSSMGGKIADMSRGVYCYKISGEVYHSSLNNIPIDLSLDSNSCESKARNMSYAELFLYDTDTAVNIRMQNPRNSSCKKQIMSTLAKTLYENSPYAESYRRLRNAFDNEVRYAQSVNIPIRNVTLVFTKNLDDDQRVYNAPSSNEVALVFVSDRDGNLPAQLDFVVYPITLITVRFGIIKIIPLSI